MGEDHIYLGARIWERRSKVRLDQAAVGRHAECG